MIGSGNQREPTREPPAGPGRTRVTVVVMDDPRLPGPNEQGVMKDISTALTLARNGQSTEKRP